MVGADEGLNILHISVEENLGPRGLRARVCGSLGDLEANLNK